MTHLHTRLLVACILVGPFAAPAQKLTVPRDAKTKVAAIFARYNRMDTPGCTVGATVDGAGVLAAAYGMADLEHGIALTPDSVLEAGSVSKQFTATAVLLLAQQGKLSLDDPVRKYIPELPDYGAPVTIRHMLTHTSGLRDWGSVEAIAGWPRGTRSYTHAHVLDIVSRQRVLNYPPGTAYTYSNTGYNLSAILVSRLAGKPFAEFTRETIFTPLGMASTEWRDDFRRIVRNRAIAYSDSDTTVRQNMPFEDVHGNGGLLTTTGDLLRWNQNFTELKLGGRALLEAQQQRGKLSDGKTIAYASGLMMLEWKGLPEISHSGSTAGYRAWLGRYPEQGLSVAVLCNAASANATQLGRQVADVFLGDAVRPAAAPPAIAVDAAALAAKAGMYRSTRDHAVMILDVSNGQLRTGGQVLRPIAPNIFMRGSVGRGEFETDASGKVVRLRVSDSVDPDHVFEKVERVTPSRGDLEALAGEYASDEAEVTLSVALDGDRLVARRRPAATYPLTPTYRDGFASPLGSVRFLRDTAGKVTELSIGETRVWDLRFRRAR